MFIMPSFRKSVIVEQFQGNYLKQALNSEGKNSFEPFSKEFKGVLLYSIKTVVSHLKKRVGEGTQPSSILAGKHFFDIFPKQQY